MTLSRTQTSISCHSYRKPGFGKYVLIPLILFLLLILGLRIVHADTQTTSGQSAQDIIDQARVLINAVSDTKFSDSQLLRFLNDGVVDLVGKSRCLQSVETKSVTSGATVYTVTAEYSVIAGVIYTTGATTYNKNLLPSTLFDVKTGIGGSDVVNVSEPNYYYDWNNTLYVWPPSSTSSGSILVFLIDKPANLSLASALTTPFVYDRALVYYVCWHALLRDSRYRTASDYYQAMYDAELTNHRGDYLAIKALQAGGAK